MFHYKKILSSLFICGAIIAQEHPAINGFNELSLLTDWQEASPQITRSFNNNPGVRAINSIINLLIYYPNRGAAVLKELQQKNVVLFTQLSELLISPRIAASIAAVVKQYQQQVPNELLTSAIDSYINSFFITPAQLLKEVITPIPLSPDPYFGFKDESGAPNPIALDLTSLDALYAKIPEYCKEARTDGNNPPPPVPTGIPCPATSATDQPV